MPRAEADDCAGHSQKHKQPRGPTTTLQTAKQIRTVAQQVVRRMVPKGMVECLQRVLAWRAWLAVGVQIMRRRLAS